MERTMRAFVEKMFQKELVILRLRQEETAAAEAALATFRRAVMPPACAMKLEIPGRPITKKNSMRLVQRGGRILPIPSKQFQDYQEAAGWFIPRKQAGISAAVNVRCLYYMPSRGRVDLVNLLESTCDILVHYGVLADDHSGIVVAHDGSRVLYDKERPRVEITIEEVAT